jgi:hypothetical protein
VSGCGGEACGALPRNGSGNSANWQTLYEYLGLVSSLVDAPTAVGWLRPVILVPVGALAGLPPTHIEALLAHELAHIRRGDYFVNMMQSIAEALLFYHPAVWWISAQIRMERELCCDDIAVEVCGDASTYMTALAELETCRTQHARALIAANGGSLLGRIRRLAGYPENTHAVPGIAAAAAMSLVWILGVGMLLAQGAPASQRSLVTVKPLRASQHDLQPADESQLLTALLLGPIGPGPRQDAERSPSPSRDENSGGVE